MPDERDSDLELLKLNLEEFRTADCIVSDLRLQTGHSLVSF